MLTFEQIKELIELVAVHRLQGLTIDRSGFRLRIDGLAPPSAPSASAHPPASPAAAGEPAPARGEETAGPPAAAPAGEAAGNHVLNSPIVGTFYRSPAPDAPPFVEVGSRVRQGQVLCIIEAMKLMNEIESDVDGVIAQVFPQNAQAVEFGEPLFSIRTS